MKTRPDQWTSHYNLGNFYLDSGDFSSALSAYNTAITIEPHAIMPMVNAAMAHSRTGKNKKAEKFLKMALAVSPDNATANFNMGLLKAEQKKTGQAEMHLRRAIKADQKMHEAIFSLGMLLAGERPEESVDRLRRAFKMNPDLKYAYTLAFYLYQNKDFDCAEHTLRLMIDRWPTHADAYLMLADIQIRRNLKTEAIQLLDDALSNRGIKKRDRLRLAAKLRDLHNSQ